MPLEKELVEVDYFNEVRTYSDPNKAVDEYLQNQKSNSWFEMSTEYFRRFLGENVSNLDTYKKIKAWVVIPAQGNAEKENIYNTLEQFKNQTLPRENIGFVVFCNTSDENIDSTYNEHLLRFKNDNPDFNIIPLQHFWSSKERESLNISVVRKIPTDFLLSLLKYLKTDDKSVIISFDADLAVPEPDSHNISIDPEFLVSYINILISEGDREAKAEFVEGGVSYDYTISDMINFQFFKELFEERAERFRSNPPECRTVEANSAFTARVYALIGGYDTSRNLAEGRVFKEILYSTNFKHPMSYQPELWAVTSNRRALNAALEGVGCGDNWYDWVEENNGDSARQADNSAALQEFLQKYPNNEQTLFKTVVRSLFIDFRSLYIDLTFDFNYMIKSLQSDDCQSLIGDILEAEEITDAEEIYFVNVYSLLIFLSTRIIINLEKKYQVLGVETKYIQVTMDFFNRMLLKHFKEKFATEYPSGIDFEKDIYGTMFEVIADVTIGFFEEADNQAYIPLKVRSVKSLYNQLEKVRKRS